MEFKRILVLAAFSSLSISIFSQLRLANIFGDEMVLQRNQNIKIWGWSKEGVKVSINFLGDQYNTITDNNGKWLIEMNDYPAGGPFSLKVKSSNQEVYLKNIYVGDVWLCSGQSNMHMKMKSVRQNYPEEFNLLENKNIRFIEVPLQLNFNKELEDIKSSNWTFLNSKSINSLSATAYFFVKELESKIDVPIGLIISAVGGSPVESWISEQSVLNYDSVSKKLKEAQTKGFLDKQIAKDINNRKSWFSLAENKINGKEILYDSNSFDHTYKYKAQPFHNHNGVFWFKKEFNIDNLLLSNPRIYLGKIGDCDSTFLNGVYIGNTKSRYIDREYKLSKDLLKLGENLIAIKVYNYNWRAGFMFGDILEFQSKEKNIQLMSNWLHADICKMPRLKKSENPNWRPVGLFNGMIAPLKLIRFTGVIWYQGEANAKNELAFVYRNRFATMIKDWRYLFKNVDLPFLYVQLPNYLKPNPKPSKSAWAMLRESQLKVSELSNTAMITSIDIGEKYDIHPKNKKEIGSRLSSQAMRLIYNDGKASKFGTFLKDILFVDGKVIVNFTAKNLKFIGNGENFNVAIAGENKKFYWAKVSLDNGVLTAWSENVNNPIAIRYAWANNPETPLIFNQYNIPISPFRSDNW
jgi:sialate O-acetylesterase